MLLTSVFRWAVQLQHNLGAQLDAADTQTACVVTRLWSKQFSRNHQHPESVGTARPSVHQQKSVQYIHDDTHVGCAASTHSTVVAVHDDDKFAALHYEWTSILHADAQLQCPLRARMPWSGTILAGATAHIEPWGPFRGFVFPTSQPLPIHFASNKHASEWLSDHGTDA